VVDRDPAEVHRDGGRRLPGHLSGVVDPDPRRRHDRFGRQWGDLGDGPDQGRLADAEPTAMTIFADVTRPDDGRCVMSELP
jgi:hypothetical protein